VTLVAHALGTIVSIIADGGDGGRYGDTQGPGGAAGTIHAYTDGSLFDDLKVVQADGGSGRPDGPAGARLQESSPLSVAVSATGTLTFQSRSPGAERYRVLRSVGGAAPTTVTDTTATSLAVGAPLCQPVTFTVVAISDAVRWTSGAPAAVGYIQQPSARQTCHDVAKVKPTAKKVVRTLAALRRAHWKLGVPLTASGAGSVQATLRRGKKKVTKLATAKVDVVRAGATRVVLALPKAARRVGRLHLILVVTSPDGSKKVRTDIPVTIRKDAAEAPRKHKGTSKTKTTSKKKGATR
jgi:hypothetical protein